MHYQSQQAIPKTILLNFLRTTSKAKELLFHDIRAIMFGTTTWIFKLIASTTKSSLKTGCASTRKMKQGSFFYIELSLKWGHTYYEMSGTSL